MIVYCQNEFFTHTVLNKFEMDERRNIIKKDFTTLGNIHFSANMRRMIDAIPGLMGKTEFVHMDFTERKAIETFIENFILFAISLNITTVAQMVMFCVPRSTYNSALQDTKHELPKSNSLMDDKYFKESVDVKKSKPIFIILESGSDIPSSLIKWWTKSPYSHAMLSLDAEMTDVYGFDTEFEKDFESGNKHGFHREDMSVYDDQYIEIYAADVSLENYNKIKDYVYSFKEKGTSGKYDWSIILNSMLNIDKKNTADDKVQVCSTFVDAVLKQIDYDLTGKVIPSPKDLGTHLRENEHEFKAVYKGLGQDFNVGEVKRKLAAFSKSKDSNEIGNDDVVQESVDTTKNKPVYIILIDSHSFASLPIRAWTHSKYCHASLSMDLNLDHVYSFTIWNDGLTIEDIKNNQLNRFGKAEGVVYAVYIPNDKYDALKKNLKALESNRDYSKYNWGLIKNILFNKDINDDDNEHQICSSFVSNMFKSVGLDISGKNLATPQDIEAKASLNPDKFVKIYTGKILNIDTKVLKKKVKEIAGEESTDILAEYVTECCLLKTNNMLFKSKIPFNINMRNIVLEDMHPNFKDTVSGINFILHDERSPIKQMIVKYGSDIDPKSQINPDMIVRMFIGNPCCRFDNFSNYANQFNEIDFHTDVNWLDKITYGDPYQASNYRSDALGNDHKHPIQQTLTLLYQMYGDNHCKNNEQLANNIMIVGEAMIGVITVYKECGIENWELVRDILAVFGEIMTKCMIRLYNNHMTVIVASDAMDDTMCPAYVYNESFVYITEDGEKPTVTITDKDSSSNANKKTGASIIGKTKEVLKQTMHAFSGWITDQLAKFPQKFLDVHKAEVTWINDQKTVNLHNKMVQSIKDGQFSPKITNWPMYKVPVESIKNAKTINEVIADFEKNPSTITDIASIKEKFYSNFQGLTINKDTMNNKITKDQKNKNLTGESKAIINYVLYGNSNGPTEQSPTQLTGEMVEDLRNNVKGSPDALKIVSDKLVKELKDATSDLEKRLNAAKDEANQKEQNGSNAEEKKTESYVDTTTYADIYTEADGATVGLTVSQLEVLFNAVRDLSSVWGLGVDNAIATNFYRTSYTLYRDLVTAYQQSKGKFQDQTQTQEDNTPVEDAAPETPNTADTNVAGTNAEQPQG